MEDIEELTEINKFTAYLDGKKITFLNSILFSYYTILNKIPNQTNGLFKQKIDSIPNDMKYISFITSNK